MNPWYTPHPNTELPRNVDPHAWAAATANRSDADLIESLADDLLMALRAVKQLRLDLEATTAAEQRLLAWQANAFQTVKGWARVGDLVPGSFRLPGARLSDCTHAYIDHLREENRTLAKELLTCSAPMPTVTFADGETLQEQGGAREEWIRAGRPPVRRSHLGDLFWEARRPSDTACGHLIWDESRGAYGPWCHLGALYEGRCHHHIAAAEVRD